MTDTQQQNRYDIGAYFVPAQNDILPPAPRPAARAYPITQVDAPELELPATVSATVKGGYVDRARAFNIKVSLLSLVTGFGLTLTATAITATPLLSLAALGWLGAGFFATWLSAYALDAWLSPEGTAFLHTLRAWRWLDREQAHRHAIEWRERFPEDYEQ